MLTSGVLSFDAQGRILCTLDPPNQFNGGTPTLDGLLCISENAPQSYLGGFAYTAVDFVCSSQPGANPNPDQPLTGPEGRLKSTTDVPSYYYAGLPIAANGLLCLVLAGPPPVDEGAFDMGFDNSFDIAES